MNLCGSCETHERLVEAAALMHNAEQMKHQTCGVWCCSVCSLCGSHDIIYTGSLVYMQC